MSTTKHIAIIPAKKESLRLPCKNTKAFLGEPLFMHSVRYALSEGVMPVVSTDSSYIINIKEGLHMSNCNSQGCGSGFVVCLVLFILLVIIGCICF